MTEPALRFGYADTALGQLHYAEAGEGAPVLLLHQTPRSWDEFREVLPLLAKRRRAIAMDMYGFGLSAKPAPGTPQTIEQYASGAVALADALGLDRFAVVGHHTGAFVATEVAAAVPGRVLAAVISAGGYNDAASRTAAASADRVSHGVDVAPVQEDGGHLQVLWGTRYPLYPKGRPDILDRYIRDALAWGVDPAEGHAACGRYRMEERVDLVTAPLLLLSPTADPASYPHAGKLAAAFPNAQSVKLVEIEGGMIPLMEQKPAEVAAAVESFLDSVGA